MSAFDTQVAGDHYRDMPIQPAEFIHRNGLGFIVGCCIKYLCRYKHKAGRQDLEKARHYIDLLIEMEYADVETVTVCRQCGGFADSHGHVCGEGS